jgi:hypothetical protein
MNLATADMVGLVDVENVDEVGIMSLLCMTTRFTTLDT